MALFGKRIILTGGSGGLGQLVAAELLREGADVTVMSRTWIAGGDNQVRHVAVDLSTPEGIAEASTVVAREEPDLLVNMAGVQYFGPAECQPFEDYARQLYDQSRGAGGALPGGLPAMKRRNSGQIVNVGSILGSIPLAHFAAYSSAKAGLRAFSEALRRELADTDVSVTHISPRAVRTPISDAGNPEICAPDRMNIDHPDTVAAKILRAIKQREKDVYIGFPERIFSRLNAVLPRLVDAAVAGNDRKSKKLFPAQFRHRRRGWCMSGKMIGILAALAAFLWWRNPRCRAADNPALNADILHLALDWEHIKFEVENPTSFRKSRWRRLRIAPPRSPSNIRTNLRP